MRKYLVTSLLLLAIGYQYAAIAQLVVRGEVRDKLTAEPLEGVTVSIKERNIIASTDRFGKFIIQAPDSSTILLFSHIGFKHLEQIAGGNNIIALERGAVALQDVIISGTLHENYFNTISKIDLNTRPVRSSQELLRIVPGLFIAQHAGGGKAEQIFLRGFDIDHGTDVQVSVDGLPVNMVSHGHGQGYADLHFLIPELVKNIDYGKGPYYTDHGNLNTAGYVAFQTINSPDNNRLQIEGGQFDNVRALAMMRLLPKENRKQQAYIASEFMYFNGPFQQPQHFNRFNVFGKYNAMFNDRSQLTFIASAFSSNWNASGQIPQRLVDNKTLNRFGSIDNSEGGFTGRYNASISYTTNLHDGSIVESQAYYSRYYFRLFSNFTFYLRDSINGDEIKQGDERDIIGFNTKYTKQSFVGQLKLKTTLGAGIRADKTYNTELAYTRQRQTLQQVRLGNITESNTSAYLDEKIEYRKWLMNVGARIDYLHFAYNDKLSSIEEPSQNKAIISPKFNLQYTFSRNVQLFLKAGKGFHSNDARVVVGNHGKNILPPAYGADLGVILHPQQKFLLNASLWYLYLQQEFVYVGDEGIIEPSGRSQRLGIDMSARYQYNDHLLADVNVNLASARFIDNKKGDNYIPLAPLFTSTGGLTYKIHQWSAAMRYRYIQHRPANENNSVIAKGYFLTDASINYNKGKYEVGVIIENLLNTKWNEAQFDTESRLQNEPAPVSELHFTPGIPIFAKVKIAFVF